MIALLTATAVVSITPIVEVVEPNADSIVLQAVAELPELGEREMAQARILADVLPEGTEDYSAATIRRFSSLAGKRLTCTAMPDHIGIKLTVPRGQLATGVSLLDSIIRRASLPEEAIAASLRHVPSQFRSYWWEALNPWKPEFSRITREQVMTLYYRAFQPDRLAIAVGGAISPGEAIVAWGKRFEGWKGPRLPTYRASPPAKAQITRLRNVTTIDIAGPPFSGNEAMVPQRLLAAIALGSGKGSTAFRIWRDSMGLSYRQEAVVWPDPKGFRLRLIAAMLPISQPDQLTARMRTSIGEDIAKWNFETLERANGMAEGILLHGAPVSPLYLSSEHPIGDSLDDRTFMAAYWLMKTGTNFDARRILTSMRAASLEDIQKVARELVENATTVIVQGSM